MTDIERIQNITKVGIEQLDYLKDHSINIKDSPEFKTVKLIDLSEDSINRIAEAVVSKLDKSVRHGRWVEHHEPYTWMGYTYWSCPKCGFEFGCDKDISHRTNYCPNCGAKMDEDKVEE